MTSPTSSDDQTRALVLKILSDGEVASVSTPETKPHLGNGDEYLDLEQLQQGVQRARGLGTPLGQVLPRKAVHEDTWRKILRQLAAAPVEPPP